MLPGIAPEDLESLDLTMPMTYASMQIISDANKDTFLTSTARRDGSMQLLVPIAFESELLAYIRTISTTLRRKPMGHTMIKP